MEQDKIKLIYFYVGIFVIGIVLMTYSLQGQIIYKSKIALSIAQYFIGISLLLTSFSFYCKFEYFNDLFRKQGIKNVSQLFIVTNSFWFLIFGAFFLDQFLNNELNSFNGADVIFMILLFGAIIVNFILAIFSLHTNYEASLVFIKKQLRFTDLLAILIVGIFITIFSFITLVLIYEKRPTTAICFTTFNFILINVLSAILKK